MRKKKPEPKKAVAPSVEVLPNTQIVVAAPATIEVAAPPSPEAVIAQAERQIKIRRGYIKLIAHQLRPEEVLVFGGRDSQEVYLPKNTCMNLLSWSKVEIHFDGPMQEHRYTSPDGEFLEFVINAIVVDPSGRKVPVVGNRSTRDEFFGVAGKERTCPVCNRKAEWGKPWPDAKWEKWFCPDHPREKKIKEVVHYLPLYDVDIASVRQSAVANLWNHALEAIGLRPNLLDLKEAGMDITRVKKIGFGSDREEAKEPEKKAAAAGETQPKKQTAKPDTSKGAETTSAAAPSNNAPAEQRKTVSDRTASQATNDRPTGATPPKAEIPNDLYPVRGVLEWYDEKGKDGKELKTGKGTPMRKVTVKGVRYTIFDNREMKLDGTRTARLFDILKSLDKGAEIAFLGQDTITEKGAFRNATCFTKIGSLEWLNDGTPCVQREIFPTEYVNPDDSRCPECGSSFGIHLKVCSRFAKKDFPREPGADE